MPDQSRRSSTSPEASLPDRIDRETFSSMSESELLRPETDPLGQRYGNGAAAEALGGDAGPDPDVAAFLSGGQGIDGKTAAFVDQGFGQSVASQARIHTDAQAQAILSSLGDPLAAALGWHILVRPDVARPGTAEYIALLTHELTHSLQTGGRDPMIDDLGDLQASGGGAHESEADRNGVLAYQALQQPHLAGQETGDPKSLLGDGGAPMFQAQASADGTRAHRCIAGCTPVKSLADNMRQQLGSGSPPSHRVMVDQIHGASVSDRRAVLNDAALRRQVDAAYTGDEATTIMSALLEGSQEWENPTGNDFFAYFVTNGGTGQLPNTATMNCWESIMYAAYLVGEVSASYIATFYTTALGTADPTAAIWSQLGFSTALDTYDPAAGRVPTNGQLVFYKSGSSSVPGHVAVSLGGNQIISLWNQPNNIDAVQRLAIDAISGTIYYGSAPW